MEQEDRDMLIRIDQRTETIVERLNDHGKRIRALETWKNTALGVCLAAGATLGVAAKWIKLRLVAE